MKTKGYFDSLSQKFVNGGEAHQWLYNYAKRNFKFPELLEKEESYQCVNAFKKRYNLGFSDAVRVIKGLSYGESGKKYSSFLDTQFGDFNLSIKKRLQ